MSDMWKADTIHGDNYAFYFQIEGGKHLVKIHEVLSKVRTGPTTNRTSTNAFPEESRELPLSQQDAEALVRKYLDDMPPKSLERIVARLCAPVQSSKE